MTASTERESKTITTPNGHTVAIKTYLTAREGNVLKKMVYERITAKTDGINNSQTAQISGSSVLDQEAKALEILLVAVNGSNENLMDRLLDMKLVDYDAVVKEVNIVTDELFPTVKPSSTGSATSPSAT